MITLQNDQIQIKVKPLGAELCSVFRKANQLEYMWQASSNWPKHSPLLFPIVGQLKDNYFKYNDQKFVLPRHGFAREKNFSLIEQGPNRLVFKLTHDEETLKVYPFHFNLEVEYALRENTVVITYVVENINSENMYFSIGAHPAFKVPLMENENYNDYKLVFDKEVTADIWSLDKGLLMDDSKEFLNKKKDLPLTKELFEKDALVFKNFDSASIQIQSKNHAHGMKFNLNGPPFLGLWAAKDANFICIEPWHGIADSVDCNHELISKEGIITLKPKDEFSYSYSIQVY